MKILFDEKVAMSYDSWFETKKGLLADNLEKELILRIADLRSGESILDVGCGTGHYLPFFSKTGMKAVGTDISLPMLRVAQKRFGLDNRLCMAKAEVLPFKTKSFDCVSLITTLEFVEDPSKALEEAVRVSRREIILGILNKCSLTSLGRRIKGIYRPNIYNKAKFYSILGVKELLTRVSLGFNVKWGSTLTLPLSLQQRFGSLERILSFRKNPFGAFLVLRISIKQ